MLSALFVVKGLQSLFLGVSGSLRENLFVNPVNPIRNFYLSPGFASRRQAHEEIRVPILRAFVRKPPSIHLMSANYDPNPESTATPYDPIPGECTMSINVVTLRLSMQGLV